ncbi:MAG: class I SAM-dependent methyltransferase [Nitrospinota bacterium]
MERGDSRALLARYRFCPWRERLHVALRCRMMNLWPLEAEVPREGRVADLGSGQGLAALALAASAPAREVVGIEREERKVEAARRAGRGLGNLSFRPGDLLALAEPEGSFDAALLLDVLYLWPAEMKRRILANAHRALRTGGLLLVHEVVTTPAWKYGVALLQEWVALNILRTTASRGIHYASREENESLLRACGFEVEAAPFHRGRPYAHWLFRCRKA